MLSRACAGLPFVRLPKGALRVSSKKSARANQVELTREFCEGTGYSKPHQVIAAGIKSLDDWTDLVLRHREYREAHPLQRGPGFKKR